ncbi:MAG: heavy metal translocating P-type ATPase metal-binding domain-containing protein [Comamonadaceae bacterium]|nr:heavy metal translocating P-type ATPase metal-binding domain-containing protein [Comamonadaceae bacterium]
MSAGAQPCFHCGEPIPRGLVIHARIAGRDEPVCCHGCKAVAEFITGAGLGDYYRYRDTLERARRRAAAPRPLGRLRPARTRRAPDPRRAERRTLDHRAARGPALRGLQLARRQGAVACRAACSTSASTRPRPARAWCGIRRRCGSATCCACSSTSGLRPHPLAGEPSEQIALLERRSALKRLAVAGFGNMQVMMFARAAVLRRSRRAWTRRCANTCAS